MVDWARTVHGTGDLHAGGVRRARVTAMLDDVQTLPVPAAHLQIGDATERGLPEEDVLARRWLDRLPGPPHTVLGNHDIMHNRRTEAAWAKAYGLGSPNPSPGPDRGPLPRPPHRCVEAAGRPPRPHCPRVAVSPGWSRRTLVGGRRHHAVGHRA